MKEDLEFNTGKIMGTSDYREKTIYGQVFERSGEEGLFPDDISSMVSQQLNDCKAYDGDNANPW